MRHALPFALLLFAAGCDGNSSASRHGGDVEFGTGVDLVASVQAFGIIRLDD